MGSEAGAMSDGMAHHQAPSLPPGARIYSGGFLDAYDQLVLETSSAQAWGCPVGVLADWYDRHVTSNHLDLGVGTGYFLANHNGFADAPLRIAVVDVNPDCLVYARNRLQELRPLVGCSDVTAALPFRRVFDSVAATYLLHCLPGPMTAKARTLVHARDVVREGGVVFGSTILGQGVEHSALGAQLLEAYNQDGIFDNANDSPGDLAAALDDTFQRHELQIHGTVALFAGWT